MNISGLNPGLPGGFPDVELIERLANEIFREAPAGATAPSIPSTASLDPLNPLGSTVAPSLEFRAKRNCDPCSHPRPPPSFRK